MGELLLMHSAVSAAPPPPSAATPRTEIRPYPWLRIRHRRGSGQRHHNHCDQQHEEKDFHLEVWYRKKSFVQVSGASISAELQVGNLLQHSAVKEIQELLWEDDLHLTVN